MEATVAKLLVYGLRVIVVLATTTIVCGCTKDESAVSFSSDEWKGNVASRRVMLKDLQSKLTPGISSSEVVSMLGPPDRRIESTDVAYADPRAAEYFYYELSWSEETFDTARFVVVIDHAGVLLKSFVFEN